MRGRGEDVEIPIEIHVPQRNRLHGLRCDEHRVGNPDPGQRNKGRLLRPGGQVMVMTAVPAAGVTSVSGKRRRGDPNKERQCNEVWQRRPHV